MSFVLDAPVALAWVYRRTDPAEAIEARRILDLLAADEAFVPELWRLEVLNGLTPGCRRGIISAVQASGFLDRLGDVAIRTHAVSMAGRRGQIFALAREQGLTAYDAAYLDLTLATRSGLATFDRQLAAARDRMGVPRV